MQYLELSQPPTLNQTIGNLNKNNRYIANNIKQRWTNVIATQTRCAKLTPYLDKVWLVVELTYPTKNCDPDNLFACLKYVLDGVVKAKLLRNDNAAVIQTPLTYSFKKEKKRVVRLWVFDDYQEYSDYVKINVLCAPL